MGRLSRRAFLSASASAASSLLLPSGNVPTARADDKTPRTYSAVDCYSYPGDDAIKQLREQLKFDIVGFYLNHVRGTPDLTWTYDRRSDLAMSGWGFFPTYIGGDLSLMVSKPELGIKHGLEAAQFMTDVGFGQGSVVYLDIEKPAGELQLSPYLNNWIKAVKSRKFYPGFYGSYSMADWLKNLSSALWSVELPAPVAAVSYDSDDNPTGLITSRCIATQYLQKQKLAIIKGTPGGDGTYDLSRSLAADPSDTACIAAALNIKTLK
ncbi:MULTISPECIES: glycoside hydrolase domain-containing protein [Mesorhizobium]|uniref:Rv2525c-like glycoside hydrolase-like domain-containing protein n=5 Tax=Mesorhizobium TaxID=68287 RepID=Q8KGI5_RHILI|nr:MULTISPECIES: glycoside hydrolase domain-containing protein [Mesorhizobium]MBZ9907553.1 DUF1906 domain-containing protein [Mesorhizobium sp. BR115XR7A]QGX80787.1 DUF1906 domain-containing protein [Mesorhizobium japonicum R7A]QJF04933.1 DUF1906 domain-containing protein [Mesorhizobium japonicum R7A]QJF11001.1 DUF1906 domain-containing protein [Mesorhizobium japonicum]QJI86875.1 DUF1906 domain-containing protein [Mesorhizobium japonicum]